MLKSIGLLVVGGGLAYTYVVEPAWVNWGFADAKCWMDGGVWVKADAKEKGYVAEMSKMIENRARLESGDAQGCFPEPKCAMAPTQAIAMIDRKVVSWRAAAEVYKVKLRFNRVMHDGQGLDLPGDGRVSEVANSAKLAEADFCTRYLEQTRATLMRAISTSPTLVK